MYNGLKAMIEAEKIIAAAAPKAAVAPVPVAAEVPIPAAATASIKAGPHLKKPEDITGFVEFPAGTTSLVSKYCTKTVYDKYKGKKDKAGVSFE